MGQRTLNFLSSYLQRTLLNEECNVGKYIYIVCYLFDYQGGKYRNIWIFVNILKGNNKMIKSQ